MPSFGVNNNHPYSLDDTYRRYLPIPLHFGRRGSYDLNHRNIKKTCKPTSLFMIIFVLICCLSMTWSFILEYFLYNQPTIYNDYYLYYINYSCIITARLSFLFLWTRIFPILPNTKSIKDKCKKFSIAMVILMISISIGVYLTNLWYNELDKDDEDGNISSNTLLIINDNDNNSNSNLCTEIIECRLTDPLSFYALFIQFSLIFLIIITFCIHQRQYGSFREKQLAQIINPQMTPSRKRRKKSRSRSQKRKRRKSRKKAAIALLETHDDEIQNAEEYKSEDDMDTNPSSDTLTVPLSAPSRDSPLQQSSQSGSMDMDDMEPMEPYLMLYDEEDDDFDLNMNAENKMELQSPNSFKKMKLKIFSLQIGSFFAFLILWTIHYLFGILHENFIKNHYFKLYFLFVIMIRICKGILKTFGRKLDGLRIGNVATSYEYLCEFYCNAMYWIIFRQFVVYHFVFYDDESIWKFILILVAHLLMELYSFGFKMSDWYFDTTNDLLHEFNQRQDKFYNWIYDIFKDDSNIYQWRMRLSFDLIIRINVCFVTAIIQQIYLLLMIPSIYSTIYTDFINAFNDGFDDKVFIKASIYNGSCLIAEIMVYLVTMILVYKYYWINIWESFENMVSGTMGNRMILLYWMICVVSIY